MTITTDSDYDDNDDYLIGALIYRDSATAKTLAAAYDERGVEALDAAPDVKGGATIVLGAAQAISGCGVALELEDQAALAIDDHGIIDCKEEAGTSSTGKNAREMLAQEAPTEDMTMDASKRKEHEEGKSCVSFSFCSSADAMPGRRQSPPLKNPKPKLVLKQQDLPRHPPSDCWADAVSFCTIRGCPSIARWKGMCKVHIKWYLRCSKLQMQGCQTYTIEVDGGIKYCDRHCMLEGRCSFQDCPRSARWKGRCKVHANLLLRYEDKVCNSSQVSSSRLSPTKRQRLERPKHPTPSGAKTRSCCVSGSLPPPSPISRRSPSSSRPPAKNSSVSKQCSLKDSPSHGHYSNSKEISSDSTLPSMIPQSSTVGESRHFRSHQHPSLPKDISSAVALPSTSSDNSVTSKIHHHTTQAPRWKYLPPQPSNYSMSHPAKKQSPLLAYSYSNPVSPKPLPPNSLLPPHHNPLSPETTSLASTLSSQSSFARENHHQSPPSSKSAKQPSDYPIYHPETQQLPAATAYPQYHPATQKPHPQAYSSYYRHPPHHPCYYHHHHINYHHPPHHSNLNGVPSPHYPGYYPPGHPWYPTSYHPASR